MGVYGQRCGLEQIKVYLRMIRVLHITARADHGGGPKHIIDLISKLKSGVSHFVAGPCVGDHVAAFKKYSLSYCCIPSRKFRINALLELHRFAKSNNINIIHSHGRGAGIYGRILGLLTRIPVIHTHHGLYLEKYSGITKLFMVNLERLLNYATTRVVFVSPSEVAACAESGAFDKLKSVVISNSVSIPPNLSCSQRSDNKFQFIVVTRLEAEKGNTQLIDIMNELKTHTSQFHLTIVGDGPERMEVQNKVSSYGLENHVVLLGARDDVPELLLNFDAYITASHGEAHSIAMLEAMSYALPVIASRVRGHVDMISDGVNGILFDLNDLEKAASNILQLINNPKLLLRMGSNGRDLIINNYSLEVMLSRINMLYKGVIDNNV